MLPELLLMVSLNLGADPVATALARFEQVNAYQLTLHSQGPSGEEEVIHYAYRRPGFVRMDMVKPFRGAVLIYDPHAHEVRLWPFGSPGRRAGLTLSPNNRLVRSARGHRVDESDVGTLLRNVQRLQQQGELRQLGEDAIDGHSVHHLEVEGEAGHTVEEVARFELWLDSETLFPRKAVGYDRHERMLETVTLKDIVVDPDLPEDFFSP
ncbi:LolA family protein [Litchfieldella rifensis]|uniref:Outer membrane lipoprotein carrier protein LolA n=1 Tax=Litchfieldella rifensis TaxID=762643 RepID=A0ABV7LUG4_9GAMM